MDNGRCITPSFTYLRVTASLTPQYSSSSSKGAEWITQQGARVGTELPEVAFEVLFERQWLYPNSGLTPPEAMPSQTEVASAAPLQPHALRPKLSLDEEENVHYTVLRFPKHNGESESTVFLVRFKGVRWLAKQGVGVGKELPDGAFRMLFERRWLYSDSDQDSQDPATTERKEQSSDGCGTNIVTGVVAILIMLIGVWVFGTIWDSIF